MRQITMEEETSLAMAITARQVFGQLAGEQMAVKLGLSEDLAALVRAGATLEDEPEAGEGGRPRFSFVLPAPQGGQH